MCKNLYESEIYKIDQTQLNIFAKSSDGTGKIHIDPDYAKNTPFGNTLVHGLLLLAYIEKELYKRFHAWNNLGNLDITFIKPVRVDEAFQVCLQKTDNNLIKIHLKKGGENAIVGTAKFNN